LKLISTGTLTIAVVQGRQGKQIYFFTEDDETTRPVKHPPGKLDSRRYLGHLYSCICKGDQNLPDHKFERHYFFLGFSKKSHRHGASDERLNDGVVEDELDLDERAQLVDISDSESEDVALRLRLSRTPSSRNASEDRFGGEQLLLLIISRCVQLLASLIHLRHVLTIVPCACSPVPLGCRLNSLLFLAPLESCFSYSLA